jgi:hypothetical protein
MTSAPDSDKELVKHLAGCGQQLRNYTQYYISSFI